MTLTLNMLIILALPQLADFMRKYEILANARCNLIEPDVTDDLNICLEKYARELLMKSA